MSDWKFNIKSVGQIYKQNWKPDKKALVFKDREYSYTQLDDKVRAFANFLKGNGIKPDDKVLLDTGNSPEFLFIYLGVVRNAAIIVPVNPMLTEPELKYIAEDSDATYMVIHEDVLANHGFTAEQLSVSLGLTVLVINEEMLKEVDAAPRDDYDLITDQNEVSTFLYTSGTTGKAKAAMLTHANLISEVWLSAVAFELNEDDVVMCVLPMFHVLGFSLCNLKPLFLGGTIVLHESFAPKSVVADLASKEKGITLFIGVPAMYIVLIDAGKKEITFPTLKLAASGASSLPVEVLMEARNSMKLPVVEGYGLTEASPATCFNPPSGVQKPGSIGVPMPDVEQKIVDENDNEVPVGEVGELIIRGPNVMKGYYGKPEETAETLRGGWLHTGDIARVDEDGYYYIVDRKKDIIIVSGLNVFPREVEEVLYSHPQIKDAAVVGVDNQLRGEQVVAYVVLKSGENAHHKEILRWMKDKLAQFKLPRKIIIVDELPRNSSGKVLKRLLKERTN